MATILIKRTVVPRRKAIVYEATVPYSDLSAADQRLYDEALTAPDPYAVLRAKTMHMAELLGCTEADAERLILDRVGAGGY